MGADDATLLWCFPDVSFNRSALNGWPSIVITSLPMLADEANNFACQGRTRTNGSSALDMPLSSCDNSGAQRHSAGAMQWLCSHVGLPSEFEKYMPPLRLSQRRSARLKERAGQTLTMASSNTSSKAHKNPGGQPVKPRARGSARGRGRGR